VSGQRTPGSRPGTLYVVGTPIGNLGDLTPRAAEVLRSVGAVAAEDTRRTARLFAHLGVEAPALLSLPAFDERGRLQPVVERLRAGQDVALCTDAGTPGVSDPGVALVAAAWEAGARVIPVPGPSAALTALMASGLPADQFFFAGFLPRKGGGRADRLAFLRGLPVTLVLYEAGNRTGACGIVEKRRKFKTGVVLHRDVDEPVCSRVERTPVRIIRCPVYVGIDTEHEPGAKRYGLTVHIRCTIIVPDPDIEGRVLNGEDNGVHVRRMAVCCQQVPGAGVPDKIHRFNRQVFVPRTDVDSP